MGSLLLLGNLAFSEEVLVVSAKGGAKPLGMMSQAVVSVGRNLEDIPFRPCVCVADWCAVLDLDERLDSDRCDVMTVLP